MTHDAPNDNPQRQRGPVLLVLCLIGALALGPLACTQSSADSKQEEQQAVPEDEAESAAAATYDVPAYTGERSVQQRLNDASLAAQIKQALVRQSSLRVFDFRPAVDGKTVTLRGDVNTKMQWRRAGEVTRRLARGRDVANAVTVGGRPADEVEEGAGETAESSTAVYHTVQRGESLWEIARQYGASVQRLRSLNGMDARGLQAGERIRVR